MRNIFGQERNAIDPPFLLARRRILLVNLAAPKIGRENARLIGAFLVSAFERAAAARMQAIGRSEREDPDGSLAAYPDFYLYADEFQDFATPNFDTVLSQSRNGRLAFACFHQYQDQIPERVRQAIFGNVGTLMAFGVGGEDAERLSRQFGGHFTPEDLTDLDDFELAVKLPKKPTTPTVPFRAFTLPLDAKRYRNRKQLIEQSRQKYGRSKEKVERHVDRIFG